MKALTGLTPSLVFIVNSFLGYFAFIEDSTAEDGQEMQEKEGK